MMDMWRNIIKFYQRTSHLPRKGEMWEHMRYHSRKIILLIDDIQMHSELANLRAHISGAQLTIVNTTNNHMARVLVNTDDTIELTVFTLENVDNPEKHSLVHTDMDNVIQVLEDILLDK